MNFAFKIFANFFIQVFRVYDFSTYQRNGTKGGGRRRGDFGHCITWPMTTEGCPCIASQDKSLRRKQELTTNERVFDEPKRILIGLANTLTPNGMNRTTDRYHPHRHFFYYPYYFKIIIINLYIPNVYFIHFSFFITIVTIIIIIQYFRSTNPTHPRSCRVGTRGVVPPNENFDTRLPPSPGYSLYK